MYKAAAGVDRRRTLAFYSRRVAFVFVTVEFSILISVTWPSRGDSTISSCEGGGSVGDKTDGTAWQK